MVRMQDRTETPQATNFNAIRISVASPEQIVNWSHGEVTKPETINYRTLRPEKDGLFCERLFGPTKDWECFCGKYKRIRYRGVVCDRCGVEVTRAKVRRERMGHIRLAAPVAHIWFAKTTPSRLGTLLDLSPRNLERVLYFAQHIITAVDDGARQQFVEEEQAKFDLDLDKLQREHREKIAPLQLRLEEMEKSPIGPEVAADVAALHAEMGAMLSELDAGERQLREQLEDTLTELEDLRPLKLLSDSRCRQLKERYGDLFQAGMGAEAILEILRTRDLEAIRDTLVKEMRSTSGQRRKKAIKRLRVVESFRRSGNRIEDIILTVLPVLPPELRPMVQLDGGRFATSDLNDLYRRVINRNNRLKRLMDLSAPEIIIRNEKRMLQESVDALIDNGRRGRPISGSHNHKLKSLSDLLRGKQGRFRQNLLGKRVDYSGRSVIVVGPELKMHQCGLPKRMALELFKPFVMHRLVLLGLSPNIKSAKRMVERARPEVWDILENVIRDRPVLLNRAPTLHRLGIQAFMPVLIEGHAIQLHPLVCSAFNADFDGDQMAVHVPLSKMAVHEAKTAMLSTHNMLSPASGDPLVSPTLDMVMGCYYLTQDPPGTTGSGRHFYANPEMALNAYADGKVDLHERIFVSKIPGRNGWVETTVGRLIFNGALPPSFEFQNCVFDSRKIRGLTADLHRELGNEETAATLDELKRLGFQYATASGTTVSINDIQISGIKAQVLNESGRLISSYAGDYDFGLMDDDERYAAVVNVWTDASEIIQRVIEVLTRGSEVGKKQFIEVLLKLHYRNPDSLPESDKEPLAIAGQLLGELADQRGPSETLLREAVEARKLSEETAREIAGEITARGRLSSNLIGVAADELSADSRALAKRLLARLLEGLEVRSERSDYGGIGAMTRSGAKGNITQIKQMAGMRGLMTRPTRDLSRQTIELPVRSSFREGLSSLEYFISSHGARKGLTDTALNTANSGYMTRRLVDIAQEIIVLKDDNKENPEDCGSSAAYMVKPRPDGPKRLAEPDPTLGQILSDDVRHPATGQVLVNKDRVVDEEVSRLVAAAGIEQVQIYSTPVDRILGRLTASPVEVPRKVNLETGEILRESKVLADRNQVIDDKLADKIVAAGLTEVPVRSPLTCNLRRGVCRMCYGLLPASGEMVELGQAVGIIAAQSIGEPGTQLTMRTFHTGGVASVEAITTGLPRVEELFEARIPKNAAVLSEIDGEVVIDQDDDDRTRIRIVSRDVYRDEYVLPGGMQLLVEEGDEVGAGMLLAGALPNFGFQEDADEEPEPMQPPIAANVGGRVELAPGVISILWEDEEAREYLEGRDFPTGAYVLVDDGAQVLAGAPLIAGPLNPHDILNIQGTEALQRYLVDEVQKVYRNQGVGIHDKHIEVILRQMLRRVQVDSIGDTDFIPGQMVDRFEFQEKNGKVLAEGGEPATGKPLLLGVTRSSLLTDSFLAAASFQETTRVLTQAAISGSYDQLMGLKENVIIGRLIPAQIASAAYVEEPEPELLLEMPDLADVGELVAAGWLEAGAEGGFGVGPGAGVPTGYYEEESDDFDDEDEDDEDDDEEEDDDIVPPPAGERVFSPEPAERPNLSGLPSFLRNRDDNPAE